MSALGASASKYARYQAGISPIHEQRLRESQANGTITSSEEDALIDKDINSWKSRHYNNASCHMRLNRMGGGFVSGGSSGGSSTQICNGFSGMHRSTL